MAENQNKKNKETLEDLKNIGLVFGGVLIGNLIDKGTEKILKLDKNVPATGILDKIKPFIAPGVSIIGGATGAYFAPNKALRLVAGGVAISGGANLINQGVDAIADKVLSKPHQQVSGMGKAIDSGYEDMDNMRELEVAEPYTPELPELEGAEEEESLSLRSPKAYDEDEFDEAEII